MVDHTKEVATGDNDVQEDHVASSWEEHQHEADMLGAAAVDGKKAADAAMGLAAGSVFAAAVAAAAAVLHELSPWLLLLLRRRHLLLLLLLLPPL
jgi:hypothetical protein